MTYQYRPSRGEFVRTEKKLSLVDGGVFDNSGTTTAVDLFEYLAHERDVSRLILVAINADATRFDSELPARAAREAQKRWFSLSSPMPTLFSGPDSVNVIHFTNKRRSEDASWGRLVELLPKLKGNRVLAARETTGDLPPEVLKSDPDMAGELRRRFRSRGAAEHEVETFASLFRSGQTKKSYVDLFKELRDYVYYFPINLSQLSSLDPHAIPGGQSYYEKASEVGTSFWSAYGDNGIMEAAARKLMTTEQPEAGWRVGPRCSDAAGMAEIERLDDAVAFAVARAQQPRWDDEPAVDDAGRWCRGRGDRTNGSTW